jgi:hypothetical protein
VGAARARKRGAAAASAAAPLRILGTSAEAALLKLIVGAAIERRA